jgi:acetyl-CoA C-acetyltransferase
MDSERIPVIIGSGQINDRDNNLDPVALAAGALRRADRDDWLARLDRLSLVDQIAFPKIDDFARDVATALGIAPALCETTALPHGDAPVRLLNDAALRIARGESRIEAIAGAEALRTAAKRPPYTGTIARPRRFAPPSSLAARYGLFTPTAIYPLYENATRAAWGQRLGEGQAESAAIWALMSKVAAANPDAWLRESVEAATIATPSDGNRPIAHPYTKLMVANSSVNMGAALIVTSLAEARRASLPDDAVVYIGAGAAAHESDDFLTRDSFAASPAMRASILGALDANHLTPADLDRVELYSCFPCIPKMARRLIDWPLDRPATVYGGLTFGGGPIGNAMMHALAAMSEKLIGTAQRGLVFANGGYATQNHSIVLGGAPLASAPADYDRQLQPDALRGPPPALAADHTGAATIETFTVLYDRSGASRHGVIIARTARGARTLARVFDPAALAFLTDGHSDPVGSAGLIARDDEGLGRWTMQ